MLLSSRNTMIFFTIVFPWESARPYFLYFDPYQFVVILKTSLNTSPYERKLLSSALTYQLGAMCSCEDIRGCEENPCAGPTVQFDENNEGNFLHHIGCPSSNQSVPIEFSKIVLVWLLVLVSVVILRTAILLTKSQTYL